MKKIIISIVALAAITVSNASAQAFQGWTFGPKAGVNVATLTEESGDALAGLTLGGFVEYGFSDLFSMSADALYSRQGNKDIRLDYINVPILANFYLVKGLAVKAGLQPGFLMNAKYRLGDHWVNTSHYRTFELAVPVGISYSFKCGLVIDARYNLGLVPIEPKMEGSTNNPTNQVFSFTAGWRF